MTALFDGVDSIGLATRLDLPSVVLLDETVSTMDDAHRLAMEGAESGTLVVANVQTKGRGRNGGTWSAVKGSSILCTLIERPSAASLDVLSLRTGLNIAAALDSYAQSPVQLKWPNDIYVDGNKIAGILIETRWREDIPDWVAIAIGLNVSAAPTTMVRAGCLNPDAKRLDVLAAIIPAMRSAARQHGKLTDAELAEWRTRDFLAGKMISLPIVGRVVGMLASGELEVETQSGLQVVRAGTVLLEEG